MRLRLRIQIMVLVVLAVALVGSPGVLAKTVIRYAHPNGPSTIAGMFADTFAKVVKEKTDGRVEVQVFPSSQLGGVREMIEGTKMGTIQMGHNDFAALAQLLPDLAVFNVPYLYRDVDHAMEATDPEASPVLEELNQQLMAKDGVRILGSFFYGIRHLTTSNKVVKSPADMRGLKIRAIPLKVWIAMVKGMGAIPTPVDFSELPTALATGIVDGQENPLTTIYGHKFNEFQKNLMLTGHMIAALAVYINERTWDRIADDDQQAIRDAVDEASAMTVEKGLKDEAELKQKLADLGMNVVGPDDGLDIEAFRDAVVPFVKGEFPQWADYIDRIQSMQ